MPPTIPKNAYTNAPEQHPNLILGSFQLLFWLVFRPTAWENHIHRLDPALDKNFSLLQLFTRQRWRQKEIRRFIFNGFLVLPIFLGLITNFISSISGTEFVDVMLAFVIGVFLSAVFGLVYGIVVGVAGSIPFCAISTVAFGAVLSMENSIAINSVVGFAVGAALAVGAEVAYDKLTHGFYALAEGIMLSVLGGLAFSMTGNVAVFALFGAMTGVGFGIISAIAGIEVSGKKLGLRNGLILGILGGILISTAGGLASIFLKFSGGVIGGIVGGFAICLGLSINKLRPLFMSVFLIPWHVLIYRVDQNRAGQAPSLLCRHLAFWDEFQFLAIWGLDRHLLLVLEQSPLEGKAALDYLSTSRQRWAAQAAQIELDARQLERCADAHAVSQIHRSLIVGELEGPADALFRSFNRVSEDVDAALGQASAYNQRLALTAVADRLDGLLRELTRSSDKYAVRFRPIAQRWSNIIQLELDDLTKAAELRQEIDSPYIIGVPLTERQEIFVGRTDISARIEQLLLDRRRPPLLLYGQRRTGKTSLLNNLGRLLPNSIIPLFVDLQGPASRASDHSGFLYNLAKGMTDSAKRQRNLPFPALSRDALTDDPFTSFDEWLDQVETSLKDDTALLALDEFEVLDQVLVEGRFSETAVLGMLRNLIQHRPRFKVLLSGSHTLEEFQRWSSYLINAQGLHLGYLKESEARQLIERPVKGFALRYEANASQRVLDLTRGHPFLVQLLCAEIVVLKNEQDPSIRRLATLADVEAAIPEALSSGSMFFSDIERNQVDAQTLAVLRYLAAQGEAATVNPSELARQFPDDIESSINLLLRRELIETTADGYRIQVELIRRWFSRQAH